VLITGNVTLASGNYTAADLPTFTLVADGNIYISNNVTRLDGFYVSKGLIYTCVTGSLPVPDTTPANPYSNCSNKLTFNGQVVARQIRLGRTNGTLSQSAPKAPKQIDFKWASWDNSSWPGHEDTPPTYSKEHWEKRGYTCHQWKEISDPYTWSDNWLCTPTNLNLQFFSGGPNPRPANKFCTPITEPSDPHTWGDNYLCQMSSTNSANNALGLQWSSSGPIAGQYCTPINEGADPDGWSDNYLCETLQVPVTPTENANSNNAAEVFNATPDIYINPPSELRKNQNGKFDYLTNLPPIL
jgi:hypothetical protein